MERIMKYRSGKEDSDFEVAYKTITEEDLCNWGYNCETYLLQILRGEYDLNDAREDVMSFRQEKPEVDNID
jgi:hypothetical protein